MAEHSPFKSTERLLGCASDTEELGFKEIVDCPKTPNTGALVCKPDPKSRNFDIICFFFH